MNGLALVLHSLRRARPLVLVLMVVLAGFQWLMTLAARALESMNAFGQIMAFLPPAFRAMAGPALVPLMSFSGMVTVGYFHLIVMAALMALAVGAGTETVAEIEHRQADLLLSRPLWRGWMVVRSLAVLGVSTTAVLAAMVLGTWSGLALFAPDGVPWPGAPLIASLVANLAAMTVVWGTVALAVAAASRRRVTAVAVSGIAALASFLLDYIARLWEPVQKIAWLSPFQYMNQLALLTGEPLPLRDLGVLVAISAVATAVAFAAILRRDL